MGDYDEPIAHSTTKLDISWLGEDYPHPVQRTLLVSADRDLLVEDIPCLKGEFGAIAWVAARNRTRCLILRGVSDLVGGSGGFIPVL